MYLNYVSRQFPLTTERVLNVILNLFGALRHYRYSLNHKGTELKCLLSRIIKTKINRQTCSQTEMLRARAVLKR